MIKYERYIKSVGVYVYGLFCLYTEIKWNSLNSTFFYTFILRTNKTISGMHENTIYNMSNTLKIV